VSPAFIGLGSNAEDRVQHLAQALAAFRRLPDSELVRVSSLYDTDPVGDPRLGRYLNAVARLDTRLEPEPLHQALHRIEAEGGRAATHRSGARTIDLDLLYHGDRILRGPGLVLPHPGAPDRLFVLIPMLEIAPEWIDPALGIRLSDLLRRRRNQTSVRWFAPPLW
jgi:2-amino-4-hydroxy-6-hydroxymethyldihydropteridine diphosphokinase